MRISPEVAGADAELTRMDQLAHALCGCYVLSMPGRDLARLLFSVLDAQPDLGDIGSE